VVGPAQRDDKRRASRERRTETFLLSLRTAILRSRLALQNTNLLSLETNIRTPD
jgi:hypothetical protein